MVPPNNEEQILDALDTQRNEDIAEELKNENENNMIFENKRL